MVQEAKILQKAVVNVHLFVFAKVSQCRYFIDILLSIFLYNDNNSALQKHFKHLAIELQKDCCNACVMLLFVVVFGAYTY